MLIKCKEMGMAQNVVCDYFCSELAYVWIDLIEFTNTPIVLIQSQQYN